MSEITPLLSVVMPCYKRPQRTRRMLECIKNQTLNGWELFLYGDCCSDYWDMVCSDWFKELDDYVSGKGNKIWQWDSNKHMGGYGYHAINRAISVASGDYFMFLGNDDIILPNHFQHYYDFIINSGLDFTYFNTYNEAIKMPRMSQLLHGSIGHSELIVRTSFLKQMPPHGPEYGHDWKLVQDMVSATHMYQKSSDELFTYRVMSVPGREEQGID